MKATVSGINPTREMKFHETLSFGDVRLELWVADQVCEYRDVQGKVVNDFFILLQMCSFYLLISSQNAICYIDSYLSLQVMNTLQFWWV